MPAAVKNTPDNYVFGRPAKYNVKELAANLLEWIEDDRHYDLLKWLADNKIDPRRPGEWAESNEEFAHAWYVAKTKLAVRRNEMATIGELPQFVWQRVNHNYDILHYYEDEKHRDREAKRQAKAKAEAEKEAQAPQASEKLDAVMNMLSNLQSSAALNKAERSMSKAE